MNSLFSLLFFLSILSIVIEILFFAYNRYKKKDNNKLKKILAISASVLVFSLIGFNLTRTPEQIAASKQKQNERMEQEKKQKEAEETKKADEAKKLEEQKAAEEAKKAEEKAALQKKYDDQKKYEEWLAWQEQQKQQEEEKAQKEQEINSIVSAYILTLSAAIDESDNTWNKGWSLIMDSYNSGDIPTCVPAIVTLNKAMDKYYREMLNFPNVDKKVPENQSEKLKECKKYVENYIEIRLNTTAKFGEYFKKNDLNRLSDIQMNIVNSMVNDGNNARNDAINMINSLNN